MSDSHASRRRFLQLGAAALGAGIAGCQKPPATQPPATQPSATQPSATQPPAGQSSPAGDADQAAASATAPTTDSTAPLPYGVDLEKWRKLRGRPYEIGGVQMPGVCQLPGPLAKRNWPDRDKYKNVTKVPGMCQLCSTICGIVGYVKDGRLLKIEGNPRDPNSRGRLCARGQAGLNHQYHPERLLYPLKRVGQRGEGKWKRISWDTALEEIAQRLRKIREDGHPEEFAFHQGRQRSKDALSRFLRAYGTNTQLSHRSLCSGNRRAANLTCLWESDWDLNDVEHSKYILNFGSNAFEAHQGHVPFANRIQNGRFKNGAKLVTFDVRLSNTAGSSDEWFAPFPGTDGAVALAMGHTILAEGLQDNEFIDQWTNVTLAELREHFQPYTPAWAEKVSGIPAADISRIAREFAAAAPACTTMCNRGSSAHLNGFYNDRAINLLNALVGSVGKKGGWCFSPWGGVDPQFATPPMPPSAKTWSVLEDPPEYPLANVWRRMRVGEVIYLYLLQGRAKLQAYMTYNLDSPLTWPEESLTQQVLCDEDLINFHVCINCYYNETAHFADIVLPWSTYMERWDLDARASYNLRPYVGLRTPMVAPLGEARDVREFFPELARLIGGGMEDWYPEKDTEEYMRKWAAKVPENTETGKSGLDRLLDEGTWEDTSREPNYEPFKAALSPADMVDAEIDEATGVITKLGIGIGLMQDGKPTRGFMTPSRKFEVRSLFVQKIGKNEDCAELIARSGMTATKNRPAQHAGNTVDVDPMPSWFQPVEHETLADDELIMTSFKWNVHNHGRTMHLKWLAEIVHTNPAWMNPKTAERFGLQDGDWIEIVSYKSQMLVAQAPHLAHGQADESGRFEVDRMRVPIVTMQGIHPRAIAMSNSCGHTQYTRVAQAKKSSAGEGFLAGTDGQTYRDADWERNMWWEDASGDVPAKWVPNTGKGWNQNKLMPISPDPISGQQAYHDTVVRIQKLT